ncbi:MAG: hypothetical protein GF347_04815 [Candidatus Moranbacteria bacterium]|nr:hypothetical protein [Candidatus Moranbacteria bacterium]
MLEKLMCLLFLLFLPVFVCLAAFEIGDWKYKKEILIDAGYKGLVKFELDRQICAKANVDFSDIRVVQNEEEAPFEVLTPKSGLISEKYEPEVLNKVYVPYKHNSVILDFSKQGVVVNNFDIEIDSSNFQRNVRIYGANDMQNWKLIKEDEYVYDYTDLRGKFKSRDTQVFFPSSVFQYFKLEIDDPLGESLNIGKVTAKNLVEQENKSEAFEVEFSQSENRDFGRSEILIDLGQDGLEIFSLIFSAETDNFNREVNVYSSDNKQDWKLLSSNGYIFSYNTSEFKAEDLELEFSPSSKRYLKVEINNYDDQPLGISKVLAVRNIYEVVFRKEQGPFWVYYGNSEAESPIYDFEKYLKYLDSEGAKVAKLSKEMDNDDYIEPEKPLTEEIPHLLSGLLIFVILLLLLLIYGFFRDRD